MVNWFIFVQHGSHGQLKDFDPLSEAIQRQFNNKIKNNNNRSESDKSKHGDLDDDDDSGDYQQFQQQHQLKIFGTQVNEGLGTDEGTMKCVDKIMPELEKAIVDFCTKNNETLHHHHYDNHAHIKDNNNSCCCYFSCVSHSFGGILTREVTKRLFEKGIIIVNGVDGDKNIIHRDHDDDDDDVLPSKTSPVVVCPLQFVSIASPHCGVNSIGSSVMKWGGRLLGKFYSCTYQELFLDSPLLERMAGITNRNKSDEMQMISSPYLRSFTAFQDHLFVGALSHDYLVRFETATLLPLFATEIDQSHNERGTKSTTADDKKSKNSRSTMRTLQNRASPSTHVFETISVNEEFLQEKPEFATSKYSQLNTCPESVAIATSLRTALFQMKENAFSGFRVMPVKIPSQVTSNASTTTLAQWINPQNFCIAHDSLIKKGISWDVLEDVVESVAEEMVSVFFSKIK